MSKDTISERGLRHAAWVEGIDGSRIKVYESSNASKPCVWVATQGNAELTTIELDRADALRLAEDIVRVCRLHYQGGA